MPTKGKKTKVGIKDPELTHVKAKKPTGKPPSHIKMLMSLANQHGSWENNRVYKVPQQVSNDTARRWIESGAAEKVD